MTTPAENVCLAMDIGGTKVRLALIDKGGNLHAAATLPTDAIQGAEKVLATMFAGADQVLSNAQGKVIGIGISSCGVIEPHSGTVIASAPAIPGWEGTRLGDIFRTRYNVSVIADNDANCALLGEAWKGGTSDFAAAMNGTVVMFTLGTGLGGAIMVDGKLITGNHHLTGHFGIAKMWDEVAGKLVPVEWLVSGSGLRNIYQQIASATSAIANGEAVMKLAEANDRMANAALDRWLDYLALQLHNFHWMIDPDLVLIGGGVIHSKNFWWPRLSQKLAAQNVYIPLAPARLGNDAGIFGAAKLVWDARA